MVEDWKEVLCIFLLFNVTVLLFYSSFNVILVFTYGLHTFRFTLNVCAVYVPASLKNNAKTVSFDFPSAIHDFLFY